MVRPTVATFRVTRYTLSPISLVNRSLLGPRGTNFESLSTNFSISIRSGL